MISDGERPRSFHTASARSRHQYRPYLSFCERDSKALLVSSEESLDRLYAMHEAIDEYIQRGEISDQDMA